MITANYLLDRSKQSIMLIKSLQDDSEIPGQSALRDLNNVDKLNLFLYHSCHGRNIIILLYLMYSIYLYILYILFIWWLIIVSIRATGLLFGLILLLILHIRPLG
jgi:hypothetical protein